MPSHVAIVQAEAGALPDRAAVLREALLKSGFKEALRARQEAVGEDPDQLKVVIKVELSALQRGAPTGTDPRLVEHLVDILHDGGFTDVVVGDTRDALDCRFENRDVLVAAELLGFDFVTPDGRPYDVVDLSEDLVEVDWPAGSALEGSPLSRRWLEADVRIDLAHNRTHPVSGYALCIDNLIDVLPLRDKDYHYRARLSPQELAPDLLRVAPPHFCIVDAWVSSHGNQGAWVPRPLETHGVIAGADAVQVDHAAALKMGVDPWVNPAVAAVLEQRGLAEDGPGEDGQGEVGRVAGSLVPWRGWDNVHPLLQQVMQQLQDHPDAGRIRAWASPADARVFPLKDPVDQRLNSVLSQLHQRADDQPAAMAALLSIYGSLAAGWRATDALRVLGDKDELPRRQVALGLDPDDYGPDDYDSVITYMAPLERLAMETPTDQGGLRWRYLDGSVLFAYEAKVGARFDDWVQRVDVSRAVQFMNDYIGGASVVVERDQDGRALRQATRTIYLPQPNTMALSGGLRIDVCKLETARYQADEHKVWWRTLHSPNDSATHDDGLVSFRRTDDGRTMIRVVARQQFKLPPAWELIQIDRFPQVKDRIVAWSYQEYFRQTIANFEARYEGREHRIGRRWDPQRGEAELPEQGSELAARARRLVDRVSEDLPPMPPMPLMPELARRAVGGDARREPLRVDEDGFAHFDAQDPPPNGGEELRRVATRAGKGLAGLLKNTGDLLGDLGRAVSRDLDTWSKP